MEAVGVKKENILAVPLVNRVEERRLFDTLHLADGISLFDKGAAIGTAFSVVGASVGFRLDWGPIYWGLIGAAVWIYYRLHYFKFVHKRKRALKGKKSEVVLVIDCPKELVEKVEEILWEHLSLGVAKLEE